MRLWTVPRQPGQLRALGLWGAHDAAGMIAIVESLPMYGWMSTDTVPLAIHPDNPAISRSSMAR